MIPNRYQTDYQYSVKTSTRYIERSQLSNRSMLPSMLGGFTSVTLSDSAAEFDEKAGDLLSADWRNFEDRLAVFVHFCENDPNLKLITSELKGEIGFDSWWSEGMATGGSFIGSKMLKMPIEDFPRYSLLYQLCLKINDSSIAWNRLAIDFYGQTSFSEQVRSINSNIIHPLVRYIKKRLGALRLESDRQRTVAALGIEEVELHQEDTYEFWGDIHKEIVDVAKARFEDGYLNDAVLRAMIHVNSSVKELYEKQTGSCCDKSGKELDGVDLMRKAFLPGSPVIPLTDVPKTDTGKSIQEGFMQLFAGGIQVARNPGAHANDGIDKLTATHFIFLASLLMYRLENSSRGRSE
jgi:uncharacterized protein (TIGR02391 family)